MNSVSSRATSCGSMRSGTQPGDERHQLSGSTADWCTVQDRWCGSNLKARWWTRKPRARLSEPAERRRTCGWRQEPHHELCGDGAGDEAVVADPHRRSCLVPSLRGAWVDWNQATEGQEIGYKFTKKTVNFDSQLGTENGALLEAGLDYTVQNFNGISVKLYGRGGMEFWASDRGTTWRASGGVTFQF